MLLNSLPELTGELYAQMLRGQMDNNETLTYVT